MGEKDFTEDLVGKLGLLLKSVRIGSVIPLLYAITVSEDGEIQPGLNDEGVPKRGGGTGFEQDILIYEEASGETSIVPRVAIEVKFQRITTHDTLVYAEKARRIRSIYPYLRYGLLLGEMASIPPRALRLGVEFDFIITIGNKLSDQELSELARLLECEIENSHLLGAAFTGKVKVFKLRRDLQINYSETKKPWMITPSKISPPKKDKGTKTIDPIVDLSKPSFYVYENWRAEQKAVIHSGSCSSCNYGKGVHPGASNDNGRWYGPFYSFQDAYQCASETNRPIRSCKKCAPG